MGGYSSGYKGEGLVGYIPYYYTALCSWGKGWLLSHTWSYSVHSTQYAYYVMMMSHILYIYPHHICSISKSCRLLKEEELSCFHPIALSSNSITVIEGMESHWSFSVMGNTYTVRLYKKGSTPAVCCVHFKMS